MWGILDEIRVTIQRTPYQTFSSTVLSHLFEREADRVLSSFIRRLPVFDGNESGKGSRRRFLLSLERAPEASEFSTASGRFETGNTRKNTYVLRVRLPDDAEARDFHTE